MGCINENNGCSGFLDVLRLQAPTRLKESVNLTASTALFTCLCLFKHRELREHAGHPLLTLAAVRMLLATRVLANELARRTRALGLLALPVTFRFLAHSLAIWSWNLTARQTIWLVAGDNTVRALGVTTAFSWALVLAHRLLTFDVADSISRLTACRVTLRRLADGCAYCWAFRVIALPGALWTTLLKERCHNQWSKNHQKLHFILVFRSPKESDLDAYRLSELLCHVLIYFLKSISSGC
jgi:hypothetical protein